MTASKHQSSDILPGLTDPPHNLCCLAKRD